MKKEVNELFIHHPKIKEVERVLQDQVPTRQAAEEIDVSQMSVQQWIKPYKDYNTQHFLKNREEKTYHDG